MQQAQVGANSVEDVHVSNLWQVQKELQLKFEELPRLKVGYLMIAFEEMEKDRKREDKLYKDARMK